MDKGLKKFTLHYEKTPFSNANEKQKAYRDLFGSELGSKVLQDILVDAGYFKTFIPNANQASPEAAAFFDDGKKFVCHNVLNTMTVKIKEAESRDAFVSGLEDYNNY